jgi:uncharacterized tellurite resistance protein B-like protein
MLYHQFYSELGKLLYAIADADGTINSKEKGRLKEIVKDELVPAETHKDRFGINAAYYTEIEFEFLEEVREEPEIAFDSFIDFIDTHKTAIDESMLESARYSAEKLAEVFYQINSKEKEMLNKLHHKLDILIKEKMVK